MILSKSITLLQDLCGKNSPSLHLSVWISFDDSVVVADAPVLPTVEGSSIGLTTVLDGVSVVEEVVEDSSVMSEGESVEPAVEVGVVVVVEVDWGFGSEFVGTVGGVLGGLAHSGYRKKRKKKKD